MNELGRIQKILLDSKWELIIANGKKVEGFAVNYSYQMDKETCISTMSHVMPGCNNDSQDYSLIERGGKVFISTSLVEKEVSAIGENDMLWKLENSYCVLRRIF